MSTPNRSVIINGTGSYAPAKVMTNNDFSKTLETSDEWIRTRTGIQERRFASDDEQSSDLAVEASRRALDDAEIDVDQIDLVIVATMTPDMPFPSTACLVQTKLGIKDAICFDIQAACSGFVYVLEVGFSLLQSGRYRNALVIGAEKLSSILDWDDRTTCVLFGDGAGAAVLSTSDTPKTGLLDFNLGADGANSSVLHMPGGGCAVPASLNSINEKQHFLKMRGREVFKLAVRVMEQSAVDILKKNGVNAKDIDCVIPHQANLRIIESLSNRLELPMDKFFLNLEKYGNTSAASIPIALDEAYRKGKIKPGSLILMLAFGAGLTWGASLVRWR